MTRTPRQQLIAFLSDMYSIEQQALAQLERAPDIAGDAAIAADFRQHHAETQQQAQLVGRRLEALGGSPSPLKDAVMKLGGKGFILFARVQPETPGRLLAHAYAYEAMEWAGYQMLVLMAERADDAETAEMARTIRDPERVMMLRLARWYDTAEAASHDATPRESMPRQIRKHLAEAHALERQAEALLKKSETIAGDTTLAGIYRHHLEQTRTHAHRLERRLESLGADTSLIKDAALALGGFNWAWFFQAQSDTPSKLAAFVFAVEHLEIGGYELLRRSARRVNDVETDRLCDHTIREKRAMARRLGRAFDIAVGATLEAVAT